MSDLTVAGPLSLPPGGVATLTIRYPPGWRDTAGRLSAGTYVGRYAGGAWTAPYAGGPLLVPAGAPVRCTLVVMVPGLPPAVQAFDRWTADTGGDAWDFTVGTEAPNMPGAPAVGGAVPGAPGERGEAGSSFRQGAGPPAAALGALGDSYLDRTTGDLYEKQATGWVLTASLRGRNGSDGAEGPAGPRGLPGGLRPLPVLPAQERYVPVASEAAGGDGWRWDQPKTMGLRLPDLTDIDLTGLTTGQTLVWDESMLKWKAGAAIGATAMSALTDVDLSTAPASGQALIWNTSTGKWTPGSVATGSTLTYKGQVASAADLPVSAATGDTYSTADTNHLHAWNGATWVDNGPIGVPGVRGPAGDQGPAGAKGDPGPAGAQGATGRGIATVAVSSGHLAGTYTDGTAWDAGMLPAGTGTGGGLSSVAHDATMTGDGTPATPLGVNATIGSLPGRVAALEGNTGTRFVGVRAINTASQDIPNGQYWQMRLNSPVYDTDGFLDAGQNRIIIPPGLSGIYEIGAWIAWESNSTGRRFAAIRLDTNVLIANGQPAMSTGSSYGIAHIHHPLHAGSEIDLSGFQDSGSTLETRADVTLPGMSCTLYLHRLGPLPS